MPPRINGDADQMYWVLSRSDTFTVKSACMFVAPSVPSETLTFGISFGGGRVPKGFVPSCG